MWRMTIFTVFFRCLSCKCWICRFCSKTKIHGSDRFHGNGPYCKILTEKEPMRAQGLGLPYNNECYFLATPSSPGLFVNFPAFDRGIALKEEDGEAVYGGRAPVFARYHGLIWRLRSVFVSYLFPNKWHVIFQKRVPVFHRGFQTRENWRKHKAVNQVILLFLSAWKPRWNTKHEFLKLLLSRASLTKNNDFFFYFGIVHGI